MKEFDVIVIGAGLAGLTAAASAAKQGKNVAVLTKGSGAIAIGGGTIDVLGYGPEGRPLVSPAAGLAQMPDGHPYTKIGRQRIEEALAFFRGLTMEEGYPYSGGLEKMQWLPTAAGTLKPSCLVPKTMETARLAEAGTVVAAGFSGLKDYYPELVVRGLRRHPAYAKKYEIVMLESGLGEGRDITALDIARWLDSEDGRQSFIEQVRRAIVPGSVVLLPPVLGTKPDYRLVKQLEEETDCSFIETAGLPPAVSGLRLRNLLVSCLKKRGGRIIEQANVAGATVEAGRCQAVITRNVDREREYHAKEFVLASGGFFGGGLESEPGRVREVVFGLPVDASPCQEEWGNTILFSAAGQPFARFGPAVDSQLRPIDREGKLLLENVRVAGRSLGGYDHCCEKSGNGVAVASGYQAGIWSAGGLGDEASPSF